MSEGRIGTRACDANRAATASLGAAEWLSLAAAPAFAIMAALTAVLGGGQPDLLCSAGQNASPLSGMGTMYLLMSAFHSAPWLKLISGKRSKRSPDGAERNPGIGHSPKVPS